MDKINITPSRISFPANENPKGAASKYQFSTEIGIVECVILAPDADALKRLLEDRFEAVNVDETKFKQATMRGNNPDRQED